MFAAQTGVACNGCGKIVIRLSLLRICLRWSLVCCELILGVCCRDAQAGCGIVLVARGFVDCGLGTCIVEHCSVVDCVRFLDANRECWNVRLRGGSFLFVRVTDWCGD